MKRKPARDSKPQPKTKPGLLPKTKTAAQPKRISLALQGGGAHGAFTWGVIDHLLDDERIEIEAISGTSAGAMNAVVLAEGLLEGGRAAAKAQLERFWSNASLDARLPSAQRAALQWLINPFWRNANPAAGLMVDWMNQASPYVFNPLGLNPMRDFLMKEIDFEKVRRSDGLKLFIAATNVETGKIRIFNGAELTVDHLLASACLPGLFQTVMVDGAPYWDGGYMGNPAIYPLIYEAVAPDILLVQINPIERKGVPKTAREIQNRVGEISFNSSLLREMRAIDFVARLIDDGKLSSKEYKRVYIHRLAALEAVPDLTPDSKMDASWSFFLRLRDAGRGAAREWLRKHFDDIGQRGTLDLRKEYM